MKKSLALIVWIAATTGLAYGQTNTFPDSGNAGIGTTSPGAKLSFNNLNDGTNQSDGITWYNPYPLDYGIYRTAGAWSGPDYQQLKIGFSTGIILYPGTAYGKSFVDIQGGGLRVSSGNVGIGTIAPVAKMQIISSTNSSSDNTLRLEAPMIGSLVSHVHHGTTGDWYIRSAHNAGKVVIQDYAGGNVGIGTDNPQAKLHIANGDVLFQNSSSGYPSLYFKDVSGANSLKLNYNSLIHTGVLYIRSGGSNPILLNDADGGNVGIGTAAPVGRLEIKGPYSGNSQVIINSTSSNAELRFSANSITKGFVWYQPSNDVMAFGRGSFSNSIVVNATGDVGIGTGSPNEKLTVNGTIYGKEVKVDLSVPGPDYVFEKDYNLLSLEEVEAFIKAQKHLPDVPTAKEMETNGIEVGKMNMLLLKKIEELTLYVIELQNKVQKQEAQIQQLQNESK